MFMSYLFWWHLMIHRICAPLQIGELWLLASESHASCQPGALCRPRTQAALCLARQFRLLAPLHGGAATCQVATPCQGLLARRLLAQRRSFP